MNNILSTCDAYKISHKPQYPEGTEQVVVNWTIRSSRLQNVDQYVFYGLQYFIKRYLIERFNNEFFNLPKEEALAPFKRRIKNYLGDTDLSHFEALHDLGYMPLKIMALPEGAVVGLRVPCVVIYNTKPEFYWVTNYIETMWSAIQWGLINSATMGHEFAKIRDKYLDLTCTDKSLRNFLIHDFSSRGMFGVEAMEMSGSAFLLSSCGSDAIPAVDFIEEYYGGNSDIELLAASIPASEHSVACAGSKEGEEETLRRFLTKIYPTGGFSFVSDTWDYFKLLNETVRNNKDLILSRDGKIVFRPDSSPKTPLEIICGDPDALEGSSEYLGSLRILWDIFGGTTNELGYKVLDPHVGLIYGEAISLTLYEVILAKMKEMGFASSNLVVGIGSYSLQYHTRDSLGQACKATMVRINGSDVEIFKDPKTDTSGKKSAKGLLAVYKDTIGKYYLIDQVSWNEVNRCEFIPVFEDGKLLKDYKFSEIRETLNKQQ